MNRLPDRKDGAAGQSFFRAFSRSVGAGFQPALAAASVSMRRRLNTCATEEHVVAQVFNLCVDRRSSPTCGYECGNRLRQGLDRHVAYRNKAASSGRRLLVSFSVTTLISPKPAASSRLVSSAGVKWWVM